MKIEYEFIQAKEFNEFFNEARKWIFEDNFDFKCYTTLTEEEFNKLMELNKPLLDIKEYYLVAKHDDKIIGWSFGFQKSRDDFYMVNSAIFPEYRLKGIYTELMKRSVKYISELGFQHIYSRHKMSNNSIIIPKLKFGFVISGIEVNDMFGPMVILSYYTNPMRKELLEIRMGMRKPTEEHIKLIK